MGQDSAFLCVTFSMQLVIRYLQLIIEAAVGTNGFIITLLVGNVTYSRFACAVCK